jgi:thiol:disulfide interchange protein
MLLLNPRVLRQAAWILTATVAALTVAPVASGQSGADKAVTIRVVPRDKDVRPGGLAVVAVEFTHGPGFHTWPAKGVVLPKGIDAFAERTALQLGEGAPAGVRLVAVQWPEAHPGKVPNLEGPGTVTVPLYSGKAVAFVTLALDAGVPAGSLSVPIAGHYQSCNEQVCLEPQDPVLTASFDVSPAAAAAPSSEPALFQGYTAVDPALVRAAPAPGMQPPPAQANTVVAQRPSLFGIGFGGGIALLFLVAAIGGFVLNLTPCVLPVIPLKIMTLVHHAGNPRRRIALGLWMFAGVVAFWFAIGVPVMLIRGGADPSQFIFGTWWVTLSIGVIIAAMGLGIMGLFLFQLPQSVYAINPKADTAHGSFFFGVMTGVLGLPCFGFVAGGLLAGAAALPRTSIAAIFLGLGIGMGAPYLVLSIWPALINRIPRTGPASELVKQVLGLLLIAAAAWFVAAGIGGLLADMPYLKASLPIWIVSFFVLLAGTWLTIRTLQLAKTTPIRLVIPVLTLIGVAATVGLAATSARSDREDWMRAQANAGGDASIVPGAWLPYNPARLKAALASGKVVVADFTADWCINCKVLKRTILDREPVRSRLQKDDVILLEVDCTSKTSPGSAFLKELKQTGVPVLVVYGPGIKDPLVYNSYLPDTVIDAIQQASPKVRVAESAAPPAPVSAALGGH